MKRSRPAHNRANTVETSHGGHEDSIDSLLRQALAEDAGDALVSERWNSLAERVVADLQHDIDIAYLEIRCSERRRLEFMLGSLVSRNLRIA